MTVYHQTSQKAGFNTAMNIINSSEIVKKICIGYKAYKHQSSSKSWRLWEKILHLIKYLVTEVYQNNKVQGWYFFIRSLPYGRPLSV